MNASRTFPNNTDSVTKARRFARSILADSVPQASDAVELMVSELATNCVRHTNSTFALRIDISEQQVRVEMTDHDERKAVRRTPDPLEPSGRGLGIIEALAANWGVTPAPVGKTVWFTVNVNDLVA
jgi:anti-sigma regulatory factor (Ser/Thr protein kinase)